MKSNWQVLHLADFKSHGVVTSQMVNVILNVVSCLVVVSDFWARRSALQP